MLIINKALFCGLCVVSVSLPLFFRSYLSFSFALTSLGFFTYKIPNSDLTAVVCLLAFAILARFICDFPSSPKSFGERIYVFFLRSSAIIALLLSIIVAVLLIKGTVNFLLEADLSSIFSSEWKPYANRPSFGVFPLLNGSVLVVMIALSIAVPLGIIAAIYAVFYASSFFSFCIIFGADVGNALPSVVYGYAALIKIAPPFSSFARRIGLDMQYENALIAGIAVGVMMMPAMIVLSVSAFRRVSGGRIRGSFALGATKAETIKLVALPEAAQDLGVAILLAFSRAVGETTIVLMVAGNVPRLTINPTESVATVTSQMIALLRSDQPFESVSTKSAYALGFLLLFITFIVNYFASRMFSDRET